MVLLKNWPFFFFLFFNNIGQENVFYDILKRKNAFLGNKNKKFENSPFFHLFFLGNIGKEILFYDILERKNALLGKKNKKFKKSKNWHFCKMVLLKNWSFFHLFSLNNIGQENVFYDILERKNAFLGNKNKKFKQSKNWHFSKEVNPWFYSKLGIFPSFLLGNIPQENIFYDILERKNAFLSYKNKKFKKSKNWHFSKGVNPWFCSNIGHFLFFFF